MEICILLMSIGCSGVYESDFCFEAMVVYFACVWDLFLAVVEVFVLVVLAC